MIMTKTGIQGMEPEQKWTKAGTGVGTGFDKEEQNNTVIASSLQNFLYNKKGKHKRLPFLFSLCSSAINTQHISPIMPIGPLPNYNPACTPRYTVYVPPHSHQKIHINHRQRLLYLPSAHHGY